MRQVVLDTETTGLEVGQGHRVIEVGCVEIVNRRRSGRTFHRYLRPDRAIDPGATEVHGITDAMLVDKPRFADVVDDFLAFVDGAELVIHNADFDVGFLDAELALAGRDGRLATRCHVIDSLALARRLHPGQRNSLDALCRRYAVDNSGRDLHGALLDAELLADVFLAMTGGQAALSLDAGPATGGEARVVHRPIDRTGLRLALATASADELAEHERYLELLDRQSTGRTVWRPPPPRPAGEAG